MIHWFQIFLKITIFFLSVWDWIFKVDILTDSLNHTDVLANYHWKISFYRTPPYRDVNIVEPKNVFLKLIRPSDGVVSDSRPFNYIPTRSEVESKRKRRPLRILESSMQFCSSEGKEHIILMVDKVNPSTY